MKPIVFGGLMAVGAILLAGCGQSRIERVQVSGTVTLDSRPVADGIITFRPIGETSGPLTIEKIENGQYRSKLSRGVPVGTHRVEIVAFPAGSRREPGPGGPPREQLISAKYNADSQLQITLDSGQPVAIRDFDLEP